MATPHKEMSCGVTVMGHCLAIHYDISDTNTFQDLPWFIVKSARKHVLIEGTHHYNIRFQWQKYTATRTTFGLVNIVFTMPATPMKLQGTALLLGAQMHWMKLYIVNVLLYRIKYLESSEMTEKLKSNLYVGFCKYYPIFFCIDNIIGCCQIERHNQVPRRLHKYLITFIWDQASIKKLLIQMRNHEIRNNVHECNSYKPTLVRY